MSIVAKTKPLGIDYHIDKMQTYLFNALGWSNYECFGRIYKNKKHGKVIPEYCINGYDYKEVFFNDKYTATSFFMCDDNVSVDEVYSVGVALIFQANVATLYPTVTHRADEELHRTVALILEQNPYGHKLESIVTGVEGVYEGLDIEDKQLDDMGDRHVVRFNLTFNYSYNCTF